MLSDAEKWAQSHTLLPKNIFQWAGQITQVCAIPPAYEDSTHQVWRLQTASDKYVLKTCPANLMSQPNAWFWRGMGQLFGVDLPKDLGSFANLYQFLAKNSGLKIPTWIASESSKNGEPAWLLTNWCPGEMLALGEVDTTHVQQLAQHLAQLHGVVSQRFGSMQGTGFEAEHWPEKLRETIHALAQSQALDLNSYEDDLKSLSQWEVSDFVPVMLDLRWDQFLFENGELTTLVDCDAFVWAPKTLALVIVEALLPSTLWPVFLAEYQRQQDWPAIEFEQQRAILRLLLTLMQVFGPEPLD